MRPSSSRTVILVVGLFLAATACIYNLANQPVDPTPTSQSGEPMATTDSLVPAPMGTSISNPSPSTPLTIHFVMAKAPKLNEPVSITVTVKSVLDAPNTFAQLEIPKSAIPVSGTLNFQGDLRKNETAEFEAVIKFVEEGNAIIRAIAKRVVSQDEIWGDAAYIYLNIGRESSHFGFEGITIPPTPAIGVSSPSAISPSAP